LIALQNMISRLKHAFRRPSDASKRFLVRHSLKLLRIDLSKETEIQYVELGMYFSKITSKERISDNLALEFKQDKANLAHNFNSRFLIGITDVIVNTETNHIFVLSKDKKTFFLLQESTCWPVHLELLNCGSPSKVPLQVVEKAILGLPKSGYFHLLTEDLPNFLLNTSYENTLSLHKPNSFSIGVYEQTEATLVTSSKWVYVRELRFITKNLDLGYLHPSSREELLRFRDRVKAGDKAYGKKLYVSRLKSRRSIPEEALMEQFFSSEGFTIIYAENFSLQEQISIFRNATLVVAVHGAGIANLVWAEKCKLVELMPIDRINRCFEWQSYICGHEYKRIYFDEENFSMANILNEIKPLIA